MSIKTFMLGSAASFALAGILSFATPGFASEGYSGNPSQVSTPEEKAATAELNRSQANGTYVTADKLNGETPMAAPLSTQTAAADAVQEQRDAKYQAEQERYAAQQAEYEADMAQYERDRIRYERKIGHYDRADYAYNDYPHPYVYRYSDNDNDQTGIRLYLIADPTHQLAQKPIEDPEGVWVGKVRNVETGPDGRPSRIEVALNRRVSVWVRPGHFRWNPVDGVLFTDLHRRDFWNYPGATFDSDIRND